MAAKHVLEDGVCRKIGTGAYTSVVEDVWIPSEIARPVRPAPELDDIKANSVGFHDIVFSSILRSRNLRADSLAKGGRSRAQCLLSVDVFVQNRQAHAACLNEPE
ncbi:hypothetical protein Bca4012_077318 [Brassica carinata]